MTLKTKLQYSLAAAALALAAHGARAAEPRVIELTAKRYEFVPGQITLKKGEPVVLRVHSADVTHGLYLKPLGIDATLEPGKVVELTVTPQQSGRFTAICDHFCGSGHGNMHLIVVVE